MWLFFLFFLQTGLSLERKRSSTLDGEISENAILQYCVFYFHCFFCEGGERYLYSHSLSSQPQLNCEGHCHGYLEIASEREREGHCVKRYYG